MKMNEENIENWDSKGSPATPNQNDKNGSL
jgi:hypothetical protein